MEIKKLSCGIRLMRQQDISQADEIDRQTFKETTPPTNYQRELRNQLACYIVAFDSRRITSSDSRQYIFGLAGFWLLAGEAHIVNLVVRQAYRHRGIGELLLINLVDIALEKKASIITLEVRASNSVAQSLYKKYGFSIKGIRRGYYLDNGEDAVIMTAEDIGSASFKKNLNRLKEDHSRKWDAVPYQVVS